jgi:hypothetical protein
MPDLHTDAPAMPGATPPALTGSCGCGAVTFQLSAPLVAAAYCHCTHCQKRTGTAAQASAKVAPGSVTVLTGAEHLRDWHVGLLAKTFCALCGSHLFGRDPNSGEIAIVRWAAIDGDPGVRPAARQFISSAAAWEPIPDDGLIRFDRAIPSELADGA